MEGFVFAGNIRDPVRLLDRKVVTRKWGNEKAQEERETAVTQGKMKKRSRKESRLDTRKEIKKRMRKETLE